MKTYFLFLLSVICPQIFAQQIVPMSESALDYPNGVYLKDLDNELNAFTGTWKYTNGSTVLIVTLRKETESLYTYPNGDYFYEDLIIGEYKYVENDIEKVNTLSSLNNEISAHEHTITGYISGPIQSRVLVAGAIDPVIDILNVYMRFKFTRADSGSISKLKLIVEQEGNLTYQEGTTPAHTSFSVPFGEYLLVKQ